MKPKILYDGRDNKVWTDINGNMWRYAKDTCVLYKMVSGEWEQIDNVLFADMLRSLASEFT